MMWVNNNVSKALWVVLTVLSPYCFSEAPSDAELPFMDTATTASTPEATSTSATTNDQQAVTEQQNSDATVAEQPGLETAPLSKPTLKPRPPLLTTKAHVVKPALLASPHLQKTAIVIKTRPGVTETVEMAKNKLNRIVTPYANPKVLTVDNVQTKIEGAAVYLATDSDAPISLFISDADNGQATSLQLVPVNRATPVEIKIEADHLNPDNLNTTGSLVNTTLSPNQDADYLSDIKAIMQALAKQLVPIGFSLDANRRDTSVCHSSTLAFSDSQTFMGHDQYIVVLLAENKGFIPVQFEEAFCASDVVLAVAAWPKVRLTPGDKTEVFVLIRHHDEPDSAYRPSLL